LDLLQHQHALSLLNGDEAVALAAFDADVDLGKGAPNKKLALEVSIGQDV
jgi:hypothetical protein